MGVESNTAAAAAASSKEDNIFTTTEIRVNDDGKKVKVTRKIQKVVKLEKVHKSVAERKKWKKFGESANDKEGPDAGTTVIGEEVFLKLSFGKAAGAQEETMAEALNKAAKSKVIICRICKGEHWSTKCPFKNNALMLGKDDEGGKDEEGVAGGAGSGINSSGKYVPPSRRAGAETTTAGATRDDNATLRVTNLPEDTMENDLRDIFSRFGYVTRIYLSRDRNTGLCKGFAFVSFSERSEAEKALRVNGFGYQNLIMKVELSEPKENSN